MKTILQELPHKQEETFSPGIFKSLLRGKVLQTADDLEDVGFKCELGTAAISFAGNIENDYRVEIEDFGKMRGSKWVQFTPTESQITQMQNIIFDHVEEIQLNKTIMAAYAQREDEFYYPMYNWA